MKAHARPTHVAARGNAGNASKSAGMILPRVEHNELERKASSINALGHEQVAEAAYYRAEKRGFVPGYEFEDWLAAEREINEKSRRL